VDKKDSVDWGKVLDLVVTVVGIVATAVRAYESRRVSTTLSKVGRDTATKE
jgi:hypothetical protein